MDVSVISPMRLGGLCLVLCCCSCGCRSGFFLSLLDVFWPLSAPVPFTWNYFLYYTPTSGLLLLYSTLDIVGMHSNGPKRLLNCPTWMFHCAFSKEKDPTVSIGAGCNLSKKSFKPLREQLLLDKSNVSCKDLCHIVVVIVVVLHPNSQFFEYGIRTLYCLSHRQLS